MLRFSSLSTYSSPESELLIKCHQLQKVDTRYHQRDVNEIENSMLLNWSPRLRSNMRVQILFISENQTDTFFYTGQSYERMGRSLHAMFSHRKIRYFYSQPAQVEAEYKLTAQQISCVCPHKFLSLIQKFVDKELLGRGCSRRGHMHPQYVYRLPMIVRTIIPICYACYKVSTDI